MSEFTHFVYTNGSVYEVSGTVDVDKGMDGTVVNDVVELHDPYGLGLLSVKRRELHSDLKNRIITKFMDEAKELFQQRAEMTGESS